MNLADTTYDEDQSLIGITLENSSYEKGCVDVALYLINLSCGGAEDQGRLLCEASAWGVLDVVKELIEKHKVDPNGNHYYSSL